MSVETIQRDVSRTLELETEWSARLGEAAPPADLSFKPWLERAKFERLGSQFASQFRQEADVQLVTNLRERYNTATSTTRYFLVDGKLRSALLPNEDFEEVLLRGLEYRRQIGSTELLREEKEIEGFREIQRIVDTPETAIGSRMISLSPPSLIESTPYTKRFVDIWEVKEGDTGERYGETTRFTTRLDYAGYRRAALRLNPYFFADEEAENLPFDAYLLSHPIVLPAEDQIGPVEALYSAFFEPDTDVMEEELFQQVLRVSRPFRDYFIRELCQTRVDWVSLAKAFNAYLNVSDSFLEVQTRSKSEVTGTVQYQYVEAPSQLNYDQRYRDNINELVDYWGAQQVRVVAAACGISAGFKQRTGGTLTSLERTFLNSVGQFSFSSGGLIEDRYGSLEFECPKCKGVNKRPYGQKLPQCQHCPAEVGC